MIHTQLDVWKKSIELVKEVYLCSKRLPKEEQFELASQMRRAAISIPANIAEGATRRSTKDYLRFIRISYSSLAELDTYFVLVQELNYIRKEDLPIQLLISVRKMLYRLQDSLSKQLV
ncbi:four helix bundle protein [Zeaxanthinibacter enoshimensis]|uniref:Four helix bundle protein n=1 Tax=Zeaxanthinibacter enoshimensis TaxID=392009 RepID=A0A4R6TWR4_9FLAO|nr:four helix bundle protein [Zeaxanthinibacter enoshimensis]TDQ33398.1 four helix bundle protein [Zeaxanthinibacter enoshimensis]